MSIFSKIADFFKKAADDVAHAVETAVDDIASGDISFILPIALGTLFGGVGGLVIGAIVDTGLGGAQNAIQSNVNNILDTDFTWTPVGQANPLLSADAIDQSAQVLQALANQTTSTSATSSQVSDGTSFQKALNAFMEVVIASGVNMSSNQQNIVENLANFGKGISEISENTLAQANALGKALDYLNHISSTLGTVSQVFTYVLGALMTVIGAVSGNAFMAGMGATMIAMQASGANSKISDAIDNSVGDAGKGSAAMFANLGAQLGISLAGGGLASGGAALVKGLMTAGNEAAIGEVGALATGAGAAGPGATATAESAVESAVATSVSGIASETASSTSVETTTESASSTAEETAKTASSAASASTALASDATPTLVTDSVTTAAAAAEKTEELAEASANAEMKEVIAVVEGAVENEAGAATEPMNIEEPSSEVTAAETPSPAVATASASDGTAVASAKEEELIGEVVNEVMEEMLDVVVKEVEAESSSATNTAANTATVEAPTAAPSDSNSAAVDTNTAEAPAAVSSAPNTMAKALSNPAFRVGAQIAMSAATAGEGGTNVASGVVTMQTGRQMAKWSTAMALLDFMQTMSQVNSQTQKNSQTMWQSASSALQEMNSHWQNYVGVFRAGAEAMV